jgi:hypothetical protein
MRAASSGLVAKSSVLAESGVPAAAAVGRPGARDMQFPVHRRVPTPAGVDQVDGYLGILDPARSAGVLALDADGAGALLHIPGLVDHQHRLVVVQMLHHVPTHVVACLVGVPPGPSQHVLHAVRGGFPGPLGDCPAVLARQVRQQPEHQFPRSASGFDPREPSRYPAHQALERLLPAGRVYPATCGHRVIVCLHTPMISGGRAHLLAGERTPLGRDRGPAPPRQPRRRQKGWPAGSAKILQPRVSTWSRVAPKPRTCS